jgi:hypothetical protein
LPLLGLFVLNLRYAWSGGDPHKWGAPTPHSRRALVR